jgi:hypothetical protein
VNFAVFLVADKKSKTFARCAQKWGPGRVHYSDPRWDDATMNQVIRLTLQSVQLSTMKTAAVASLAGGGAAYGVFKGVRALQARQGRHSKRTKHPKPAAPSWKSWLQAAGLAAAGGAAASALAGKVARSHFTSPQAFSRNMAGSKLGLVALSGSTPLERLTSLLDAMMFEGRDLQALFPEWMLTDYGAKKNVHKVYKEWASLPPKYQSRVQAWHLSERKLFIAKKMDTAARFFALTNTVLDVYTVCRSIKFMLDPQKPSDIVAIYAGAAHSIAIEQYFLNFHPGTAAATTRTRPQFDVSNSVTLQKQLMKGLLKQCVTFPTTDLLT